MKTLGGLWHGENGQGLVEYAFLLVLVAMALAPLPWRSARKQAGFITVSPTNYRRPRD